MTAIDAPADTRAATAGTTSALDGERRERLGRVVDLARIYQDSDLKSLARELHRDPSRLIPDTGNPKVDFLIGLSHALDWPIADVITAIRGDVEEPEELDAPHMGMNFKELGRRGRKAHRAGWTNELLPIARAMLAMSTTPDERALSYNRMMGAYDAMGYYTQALASVQTGLAEPGIRPSTRVMLQGNLANAHYALWHLVEARSVATELIESTEPDSRAKRSMLAFAHYVRGNSLRRMLLGEPEAPERTAIAARKDLECARTSYLQLEKAFKDNAYAGLAESCLGAILELDATLGRTPPVLAIARLSVLGAPGAVGDLLEAQGWWAIHGSNVALEHLRAGALQSGLAIFREHLAAVAEQLDNWAFRAKAYAIELERRDRAKAQGIPLDPWELTPESMSTLIHTMGRLPAFQETGWRILNEYGALETAKKELPKRWKAS